MEQAEIRRLNNVIATMVDDTRLLDWIGTDRRRLVAAWRHMRGHTDRGRLTCSLREAIRRAKEG